jgi:hypothetical protein
LPLAAQLRTALVEQPQRGIAALAALSRAELTAVLAALGPREARRVVDATIAIGASDDFEVPTRVLTVLVPEWLPLATASASAWQAALALVARAAAAVSPVELPAVVALAAAVAAAARRELSSVDTPPGAAIIDAAGLPSPKPLLALGATTRRELLAALGTTTTGEPVAPASWHTRLGGLLLLLARIAELKLEELFGSDANCARLALLSRVAGHKRRAEVLADPLWRHLCGVAVDADVDDWLAREDVAAPFASIAARHGAAWAERLQLIATRYDQPVAIVAAEPIGEWLAFAPLTRKLRAVLRSSSVADGGTHSLAAARAAAQALAWLGPDLAAPIDRALTACAQQVLRAFARRLPGFSGSSLSFLYDSFLDFDAMVLEADGTFHCRVGRARLAAVFGLTGALRGRLPIGEDRTLELYPEA